MCFYICLRFRLARIKIPKMKKIILSVSYILFATLPVKAEDLGLEVGQSWTFKNAPTQQARVIIGKVETDTIPKIVHVFIQGLPNLPRESHSLGNGVVIQNVSDKQVKLSCEYVLTPSADKKTTKLFIRHLPMRYDALVASLVSVDTSLVEPDVYFDRAWDKWDYHRDLYGLNTPESAISTLSVAGTVDIIVNNADKNISIIDRMPSDLKEAAFPGD